MENVIKVLGKKVMIFAILFIFSIVSSGCANSQYGSGGAGMPLLGAATGAAVGALLNKRNRFQGAVIGGAIGGAAGYAFGAIQQRAINRAIATNRPVTMRRNTSNGGWQEVQATPEKTYYNPQKHTTCHKVRTKIIENGVVKEDRVKEVCEGVKKTNEY